MTRPAEKAGLSAVLGGNFVKSDSNIVKLISIISEQNIFQAKALNRTADQLPQEEKDGLTALLNFYIKQGKTVEHLAECYLRFVHDIMEEQFYFVKNRRYRYSSGEEVNRLVYQDPGCMEYYMKGLAIS